LSNEISFEHIVPELVLMAVALLVFLLAGLRRPRGQDRGLLFAGLTLAALGGALVALVLYLDTGYQGLACLNGGCKLFFGLIAVDPFSVFFRGLILVAAAIGVLLAIGSKSLPRERVGEYHGLLLVMTLGMCLLASADHLLMIYVSLETVSLCSYLLTGWQAGRNRSHEAGLKYVLYGGVASAVMLFGMSLLYGLFGELSLHGIQAGLSRSPMLESPAGVWALSVSLVLILAGLGYKVAAVPFHMWCPDVYQGAPTPFTALLSVAPKVAGFAVLMRFLYASFLVAGSMSTTVRAAQRLPFEVLIGVISVLTMTLGNLSAIAQSNVKRLLAYSSIAHAGYLFMGVTAGGKEGFFAVALYLSIYLIMNLGAFAVVAQVEHSTGSEDMASFRGLGRRAPWLAVMMSIFLFSLVGLPPTAGFVGKLFLFSSLIQRGGFWYLVLALAGILNSVISLYYYSRILRTMYFDPAVDSDSEPAPFIPLKPTVAVAALLAVATLFFGLFWQPLALAAQWSALLFH